MIGFPVELIREVSPYVARYVRPIAKAPMLLILYVCGVNTGVNLVGFTFLGELLQSGTFLESPALIIFLALVSGVSTLTLLLLLNFVMAQYDQLDALPIYQSLNMCLSIICGLIILGESEFYSTGSLVGITIFMLVVSAGVILLGFKKTKIATAAKKNEKDDMFEFGTFEQLEDKND